MSIPSDNSQDQPEQKQDNKADNLVMMRRKYERELEQERNARQQAEERYSALEQQARQAHSKDDDDSDEPYVDRKSLRREFERRDADIDKKIEKKAEEKARLMLERERNAMFIKSNPDFHQIMSSESLLKFAEKFPEVAEPLADMPDDFNRQKAIYTTIKAVGLHKPPEAKPSIQETIDKNRRGPFYQPSSAAAAPPYAQVGDFSEAGKKNAYERQQALIKGRRGM